MSAGASTTASATLPSAFAITTTFTAPTQCAQSNGGFTMLQDDQFRIWLNAPLPVPGTTISSCYADEFMSSFLLQTGGISQAAMSPLVCPNGYTTQGPFTSNYIACCPSGWDGFAPASDAPSDRPAFGGTCFTNIHNVPIQLTSYDASALKASSIFTATGTSDQAFAYPYEGFAQGVAILASTTNSKSSSATATQTSNKDNSPFSSSNDETAGNMSAGTVAALVLGSIVGVCLIVALIVFALNYRHKRLTDRKAQFSFYDAHFRLNDSPTPMMYMDRESGSAERDNYPKKGVFVDTKSMVTKHVELEGTRRQTVHEIEGTPVPTRRTTKELPDLPMTDTKDMI